MSLFVGNISRFVEQKDIEKEFRAFGDCTVDFRVKVICYLRTQKRESLRLYSSKMMGMPNKPKETYKEKIYKVILIEVK